MASASLRGSLQSASLYAGRQAIISALQSGIEGSAVIALNQFVFYDDPIPYDLLSSFGENFALNLATGKLKSFYVRNLVDTAVTTAFDVFRGARGNQIWWSLAINAAGAFGGEKLFDAIASRIIKRITPQVGEKVFRVYGGDSGPGGASWSPIDPREVPDFRNAAGLPSGGASGANNTGRFVIEGVLQDPSKVVKVRPALPLDGNEGGIIEYIIPGALDNGGVRISNVGGVNPEF